MPRTRTQDNRTSVDPKAKQVANVTASFNANRKFNRPTSIDVRSPGSITKVHAVNTSLGGFLSRPLLSGKTGAYSTMVDTVGNPQGFNRVSHQKEEWACPLVPWTSKAHLNPPWEADGDVTCEFEAGAAYAAGYNLSLAPWLGGDEELQLEALSQMHPRKVKPAFDASLELGELMEGLRSLSALNQSVFKLLGDIHRLNRWNSPSVRRALGQKTLRNFSWKDYVDLAVSADLSWKLAIKPFIELMKRFKSAVEGIKAAIQRVVSSDTTLHGSAYREVQTTSSFSSDYHKGGNTRKYKKLVYTSARIRYNSPKVLGVSDAFETKYMGFVPNLATAWELSPLSFVVDWFWNIGKFLRDSLSKPIDDIEYTVLWTGWSRKITAKSEGWIDLCEGTYGKSIKNKVDPNSLVTGTVDTVSYLRELIPLDLEAGVVPTPKLTLPSAGQLVTLGELIWALATDKRRFLEAAQRVPVGGSRS